MSVLFIETGKALTDLLSKLQKFNNPTLSLDTETTGLDPFSCELLLIQLGAPTSEQVVIDVKKTFKDKEALKEFKTFAEHQKQNFILHNAKFDYQFLKYHLGITILNLRDTMIAAHLIRAGLQKKGFSLEDLLKDYNIGDLKKVTRSTFINHTGEFTQDQIDYAAEDVAHLHKLHDILLTEIIDLGLEEVYNLECKVIPVTGDMELNGIHLDYSKWSELESKAKSERLKQKEKLDKHFLPYCDKDLFGEPIINYNSPIQLKPILEKILGYPISGTGKDVLEKIVHPAVKALLDYKKYEKRVSTYGTTFYSQHLNKITNRIHPSFIQVGNTDSGRFASRDPNAQNIPRETAYRAAFTAENGWKIVGSDYASMELVLLAEFSKDKEFRKIFELGLDAHGHVATMIMGKLVIEKGKKYLAEDGTVKVATEDVNAELRPHGKNLNFGVAYGLGAARLANELGISYDEAKQLLDKFWKLFPGIKAFLDERVHEALDNECVRSIMDNRLRWIKGFNLRIPKQKAHASNIAKNMSLQSGNATITKKALYLVNQEIIKNNWQEKAKIISTIHDEILLEVKDEIAEDAKNMLSTKMIEAAKYWVKEVPVKADAYVADHWKK